METSSMPSPDLSLHISPPSNATSSMHDSAADCEALTETPCCDEAPAAVPGTAKQTLKVPSIDPGAPVRSAPAAARGAAANCSSSSSLNRAFARNTVTSLTTIDGTRATRAGADRTP